MKSLTSKLMRPSVAREAVYIDEFDVTLYVRPMTLNENFRISYGEESIRFYGDTSLLSAAETDVILNATTDEDGNRVFDTREERLEARENLDPRVANRLIGAIRRISRISADTVAEDVESLNKDSFPEAVLPDSG